MPRPTLSLCSPLRQLRDAAGELDDLDAALDLAPRVGETLPCSRVIEAASAA